MDLKGRIFQGLLEWYPETLLNLQQCRGGIRPAPVSGSSPPLDLGTLRNVLREAACREKAAVALYFGLSDLCEVPEFRSLWKRLAQEDSFHFLRAGVRLLHLGVDIDLARPRLRISGCHCRSPEGLVFVVNEALRCKLALVQAYERLKAAGGFARVYAQERFHLRFLAETLLPAGPENTAFLPGLELLGPDPKWIES